MAETIPNRLVVLTFDDGNHTRSHPDVASLDRDELIAELDHIDRCCRDFGIPRPRTFCYPGYHTSRAAVAVLAERGYAWACCGCEPTPHDPRIDHPLLVPTSAAFGPAMDLAALTWTARQAASGCAAVFTFHGVPGPRHRWVSTAPETFLLRHRAARPGPLPVGAGTARRSLCGPAPPARHPFRTTAPQVIRGNSHSSRDGVWRDAPVMGILRLL